MDSQKEFTAESTGICDKMDCSLQQAKKNTDSPCSSNSMNRTVCAVPGCRSRYGQCVSFHSFPRKDETQRWKEWVRRLKLKYEPAPTARVCSLHFSISNFKSPALNRRTDRMFLLSSAIPDINLPQPKQSAKQKQQYEDRAARMHRREQEKKFTSTDKLTADFYDINCPPMMAQIVAPTTTEAAVQVDTLKMDKLFRGRQREMAVIFKTDSELNSWTGLNSVQMLDTIEQSIRSFTNYKASSYSTVPLRERILMVFIKLKTNLSFSCMGPLFNLHYQTVSIIFYQTVPWIKAVCMALVYWPTQTQIKNNMPHYFRPTYEDVVAVLDCTETSIKKPACLHCRINAYSHYKGRETAKYLIAVTPGGTISFISRGYGGKCSDKQIVIQENFLDKIKVGESVMTDKGFLIDEECQKRGVKLVRPPFLRAPLTQLSPLDATENVSIAAARVHVERAIQRIKQFGILNDKIDINLIPVLDDIVFITCGIANISKPILSNERF